MFWILYACGLLLFFMFFFGTYLLAWAESQLVGTPIQIGRFAPSPEQLIRFFRQSISVLNGSFETFQVFFDLQGGIVVVTLALVGSVMVGNDYTFRSLGFYLSKAIGRWHYILGKWFAAGLIVHMMTTLPAFLLYAQHAFDDWNYLFDVRFFLENQGKGPAGWRLLAGVLAYGMLLSVVLGLMLVAVASWMRRTMPLILVWMSIFFFLPGIGHLLVDGLKYDARFRLLDVGNSLSLCGQWLLGFDASNVRPQPQPDFGLAALSLLGVCFVCLIYLNLRTRSVEIVR